MDETQCYSKWDDNSNNHYNNDSNKIPILKSLIVGSLLRHDLIQSFMTLLWSGCVRMKLVRLIQVWYLLTMALIKGGKLGLQPGLIQF